MAAQVIDLEFRPRAWQADCFRSFRRFSVVVVHRRGGKTVMAIMRLVDAALRASGQLPRFGYVAPLLKQAKGIAWDYLKREAHRIPGTIINESELSVEFPNHARVRLFGADNPDSLRGLYFDGVVLDEVAQMAVELWGEVLLPTLADRTGWALFIGTSKGLNLFSTLYYRALVEPEWFAASFTCYQTGALTEEEIAQQKRELTDTQFRQEMLCDFTASSENVLIPIDIAQAAAARHLRDNEFDWAPRVMGVDVAWQGGDANVIMGRQGRASFRPAIHPGLPEKVFARIVETSILKFKPMKTFIDTTGGYGGEVAQRLEDNGHTIQRVVFSWKAESERFANARVEMWWRMAEWMKDAAIAPDPALLAQLCTPTYSNDNASNRITLESKDDIRARLGKSPDIADALALTFFESLVVERPNSPRVLVDFNPFRDTDESPVMTQHDWNPLG